ncbi:MAG: two-component system response regulator AtoC, partial [Myxococcota bacterium]
MSLANRNVLVVDDDPVIRKLVHRILSNHGCLVESVGTGTEALTAVSGGFDGVIVLDVRLPDTDGPTVFGQLRKLAPHCPVIFLTSHGTTDLALDTIRDGAFEFIEKTSLLDRLPRTVDHAFTSMKDTVDSGSEGDAAFARIVTGAPQMKALFRSVRKATGSKVSVLIHGESGTGKELIAQAIHADGPTRSGPFIAINCAGIPEPLLEAELFGYERGAFTGAVARRIGKFEAALGGTLLLDEIGEMHPMLQAKLLRVLQEGEFHRLGGNTTIHTDIRVISATNRDLEHEIEENHFRADLYYRLAVYSVFVPPLRERTGDVSRLVEFFVERFAERESKRVQSVDRKALELLQLYDYPGNVRELENIISYAVVSSRGPELTIADLPPSFLRAVSRYRKRAQIESPTVMGATPMSLGAPL